MMAVQRLGESAQHRLLGSVATPSMISWPRDAKGERRAIDEQALGTAVTPAAAGPSEGCPPGYIACLCSAIESSTRNSLKSRESVTRWGLTESMG